MTYPVDSNNGGYHPRPNVAPVRTWEPVPTSSSGSVSVGVAAAPVGVAAAPAWAPAATHIPTPTPGWSAVNAAPAQLPATLPVKRKNRAATAAITILSLFLAAAFGLGGYFWLAANRWQAHSAAWEEQARNHGSVIAETNAHLAASEAEVAVLQQHLASAQARITELANERAQLGDQQVVDQSRIDFQARLSAAAGQVASSLELCITRQDELIEALRNPGRYTEESVANFGNQVVQFCADARTANANLQAEINRQ